MSARDDVRKAWLSIPASDYEGHMGSSEVQQLQFLSRVFGRVLDRYRPPALAVVGCSTGNGFEHIDPAVTRTVIGIDVHPEYLALLKDRFERRIPGLSLACADVSNFVLPPRSLDLVHCALVLEYVEPSTVVRRAATWLSPGGVLSVVLQLESSGHDRVTHTGFTSLERLADAMRLVPPSELDVIAGNEGLEGVESSVETLESGKRFHVGAYRRASEEAGSFRQTPGPAGRGA